MNPKAQLPISESWREARLSNHLKQLFVEPAPVVLTPCGIASLAACDVASLLESSKRRSTKATLFHEIICGIAHFRCCSPLSPPFCSCALLPQEVPTIDHGALAPISPCNKCWPSALPAAEIATNRAQPDQSLVPWLMSLTLEALQAALGFLTVLPRPASHPFQPRGARSAGRRPP